MERLRTGFGAVRTALRTCRSRPRLLALPVANLLVVAALTVAAFLATGRLEPALEAGAAAGLGLPLVGTTLTAGLGTLVGVAVAHAVAGPLFVVPWTVATLFVVPALALDGGSLAGALSRNVTTLRRRPVESAAALAGAVAVVAPLAVVGVPAATVTPAAGALGDQALKVAGLALVAGAAAPLQVLVVAAGVALYRDGDRGAGERASSARAGRGAAEA